MSGSATVQVTLRYFAAARAAAGVETETVDVLPGTTIAELIRLLGARDERLAAVLRRCSFLRDEMAVRDGEMSLHANTTLDVLPPFAGG